jgi:hypothetical protein
MPSVIIFEHEAAVNQSAYSLNTLWKLEFLTSNGGNMIGDLGWITGNNTAAQVGITFANLEKALSFAERSGYTVVEVRHSPLKRCVVA